MTRIGIRALWAALLLVAGTGLVWPTSATAQEQVFVQIESHAELATAEQRARAYTQIVENVNGFRAATGLYGIALGPYPEEEAAQVLSRLLAQGLVPQDSFVTEGGVYTTQFFPVGGTALADAAGTGGDGTPAEIAVETLDTPVQTEAESVVDTAPVIPEETLQEARRSEAELDRAGREELQIALEWFGFYTAGIDGAFGPGTRRGMQLYQEDRGMEPTGVLTTRQRAQLLSEYEGELAALGMRTVRDERAGIEIDLPLAMVEFSRHNFPFAQFDTINDSGVQVLLISQPGDRSTLFGLYEIMQTLEIMPLDGERERRGDSFLLTGQSETLRNHTEARLVGGAVKGFSLIWEPQADEQMARVLPMMQSSISYLDSMLDPGAIPEGLEDDIDMVSGLEVRQPELVRSGFFVDAGGTVLTTTEIAGECAELLINEIYAADITYTNEALGLAVLRPQQRLAPMSFAELSDTPGRLRSEIAVSSFPFDGALSAASMNFGELADLRGINGEETRQRLAIETSDSEAGGPVLDQSGVVLGMVLPGNADGRALPPEVTLALRADQLTDVLAEAGVTAAPSTRTGVMKRDNLARLGADMTVTVSCWN